MSSHALDAAEEADDVALLQFYLQKNGGYVYPFRENPTVSQDEDGLLSLPLLGNQRGRGQNVQNIVHPFRVDVERTGQLADGLVIVRLHIADYRDRVRIDDLPAYAHRLAS